MSEKTVSIIRQKIEAMGLDHLPVEQIMAARLELENVVAASDPACVSRMWGLIRRSAQQHNLFKFALLGMLCVEQCSSVEPPREGTP